MDGKKTRSIKLTSISTIDTTEPTSPAVTTTVNPSSQTKSRPKINLPPDSQSIDLIKIGDTSPEIRDRITAAHRNYREVFSNDLTGGYNHHFGKHICSLNWLTSQRPAANKTPVANYDHELKGVMQEICDELTTRRSQDPSTTRNSGTVRMPLIPQEEKESSRQAETPPHKERLPTSRQFLSDQ